MALNKLMINMEARDEVVVQTAVLVVSICRLMGVQKLASVSNLQHFAKIILVAFIQLWAWLARSDRKKVN